MNFKDIPQYISNPNYRINVEFKYMEETLSNWMTRTGGLATLDLDPDFQRGHVWSIDQQIAFVEYILSGGASGREIYFNCGGWSGKYQGPFVIVDGKQRLNAVRQFLANQIPIFNGHLFKDIEGRLPNSAYLYFNVNDLIARADVLRWYIQMNTGGTPHTEQEINKVKEMLAQYK